MQNQNIYSEILKGVKTTQEREELIGEIKELQSLRFKLGENKDMKMKTFNILKNGVNLEELTKSLKDAPVVRIEIAFEPSISTIETISSWIKLNIGPSVLVQIDVDSKFLLGAAISFNGKYADMSVRRKLSEKF